MLESADASGIDSVADFGDLAVANGIENISMEKKYQVFVSSTYKDLLEERREVMQALLELDCIPVGMELFPAADDDQWTLIKRLIDDCDYYILIVGGRYGSLSVEGISYTQMEYEYALSQEIPIISFLHKSPENIPVGKSEADPLKAEKLLRFKEVVQKKMCRPWETPADLGSQVSRSLVRLIKDKPRSGWVKATQVMSEDATKEILELRKQIDSYKAEINSIKSDAPADTSTLSQGDDLFEIEYHLSGYNAAEDRFGLKKKSYVMKAVFSWDEIFAEVSPLLIDEASETQIFDLLEEMIKSSEYTSIKKALNKNELTFSSITLVDSDFQTIKIQLKALGLMNKSVRKRSLTDTASYWTLTPYGDTVMTRLRAIKKV